MKYFNDYLNLKEMEPSDFDYVIFYGDNNVGKSSYIHFLNTNNDFVLDEIWKLSHLLLMLKIRKKSQTIFVASKLGRLYFLLFSIFFKVKFINLNRSSIKIKSELERRNIDYNEESISLFLKKYNSSFKKLDKILEEYPSNSFTYSFKMYLHKKNHSMDYIEEDAA